MISAEVRDVVERRTAHIDGKKYYKEYLKRKYENMTVTIDDDKKKT